VTQTEVPGLRRIDVSVRPADADVTMPTSTVSGFVGRTVISAPPSSSPWDVGPGTAGAGGSGASTTVKSATGAVR
jgi:hypothetical protein